MFFLPQVPSEEDSLDSEILKSHHRHANHKDKFIHEAMKLIDVANRDNLFLCHEWCRWEHFDPKDEDKDNGTRAACVGFMFDDIKQWCVVNGSKKKAPDSVQSKM